MIMPDGPDGGWSAGGWSGWPQDRMVRMAIGLTALSPIRHSGPDSLSLIMLPDLTACTAGPDSSVVPDSFVWILLDTLARQGRTVACGVAWCVAVGMAELLWGKYASPFIDCFTEPH
jgi:hypothetical protein